MHSKETMRNFWNSPVSIRILSISERVRLDGVLLNGERSCLWNFVLPERMRRIGRRGRWSCGEGVRSNLKGLTLKRIDARSNVNDSAKAVVLCEYVIHVVWISVLLLAITPSVQYETKWVSERSVWMFRSDVLLRYSFFYSGDNDYRNSVVSFCNTALLLISDFFSTPLAKQKEAWYNMTRRTEMVLVYGACRELFE